MVGEPGISCFDAGDSGSFICNGSDDIVGLGMGGNEDGNLAYFVRIKDIFDDIQRRTGWNVIQLWMT